MVLACVGIQLETCVSESVRAGEFIWMETQVYAYACVCLAHA